MSQERRERETKSVFPLLAHQEDKERAIDFLAEQKIAIYCDNMHSLNRGWICHKTGAPLYFHIPFLRWWTRASKNILISILALSFFNGWLTNEIASVFSLKTYTQSYFLFLFETLSLSLSLYISFSLPFSLLSIRIYQLPNLSSALEFLLIAHHLPLSLSLSLSSSRTNQHSLSQTHFSEHRLFFATNDWTTHSSRT